MGKGGGSAPAPPAVTTQNINQNTLPEYADPYFKDILKRAQGESNRPYTPYGNQRIAGFDPLQSSAQNQVAGLTRPGQYGTATDLATVGGIGSIAAGQYNPNAYATNSWTNPGTAEQFMSPYMQNAVDVQKQEAIRDAQKGVLTQNLDASRRGTYGGARQLLATTERERNLGDELSQIQALGTQQAYQQGQTAFEQEQGRLIQNQGLGEQSQQFGAQLGLAGLGQAITGSQTLGALGESQQQSDLQRIQAVAAGGQERQGLQQQFMDTAYGDFLRQRDYPMEQLGQYSNLLRGIPVGLNSTQTSYATPPSLTSQVGGLGIAGLGIYNMFNN